MSKTAQNIIDKCGGVKVVAGWLGIRVVAVYRWTYSVERGGTGGRVPLAHQQPILDRARAAGIDLSPSDFFDPSPETPPDGADQAGSELASGALS